MTSRNQSKQSLRVEASILAKTGAIMVGQRVARWFDVRHQLPCDIPVVGASEAPVVIRLQTPERRGYGVGVIPEDNLEYRWFNGRLYLPAATVATFRNGEEKKPLTPEVLHRLLRADPPDEETAAWGEHIIRHFVYDGERGLIQRQNVPTFDQFMMANQVKTLVDSGVGQAEAEAKELATQLAVIDGIVWKESFGPRWIVEEKHNHGVANIQVRTEGVDRHAGNGTKGFNAIRLEDAEKLADFLAKRHKKRLLPKGGHIEILDPKVLTDDDAYRFVKEGFYVSWQRCQNLLAYFSLSQLENWGRLRDLSRAVHDGDKESTVPALVAFRDLIAGIRQMPLNGTGTGVRQRYFSDVADLMFRTETLELPRLGIGAGQGPLQASDVEALKDLSFSEQGSSHAPA